MNNLNQYDASRLYDVIIIGGGPAGLTAALYLARAKYRVLVIEKEQFGGQITITDEVVNYPGIKKVSGKQLSETIKNQADSFGAEFLIAEATGIEAEKDIKTVKTNREEYYCFGILIATGAHPRSVGFKGEEEYKGRGVAYCATCDGEFFTGKEIFVIGGGYAAAEEGVFLTKFAKHVTILIRNDDFSCAASVSEAAKKHEKISILTSTVVEEVSGDAGLNYIRYKNTQTEKITEYRAENGDSFGVFVFAGYMPDTDIFKGIVTLDEHGYIVTDSEKHTNIEGVFAAGDVCIKTLRQVVTATSDGALAATELEKYVASVQRKTGIIPTTAKKEDKKDSNTDKLSDTGNFSLLSEDTRKELKALFGKMQSRVILKLSLDEREASRELVRYMEELASLSEKLSLETEENAPSDYAPCVKICRSDGHESGLSFHGVPLGHEFTSFVLGIYNVAGPGQTVDKEIQDRIKEIKDPTQLKILVSLSCTMCPDTVIASQYIAANNPNVCAEIYDVHLFEEIRKRHNVMSVPCIVINDEKVFFGKKTLSQLIDMIK